MEEIRKVMAVIRLAAPVHMVKIPKRRDWFIYIPRRYANLIGLRAGQYFSVNERETYVVYKPSDQAEGRRVRRIARKHFALPVPPTFASRVRGTLRLIALSDGTLILEILDSLDTGIAGEGGSPVERDEEHNVSPLFPFNMGANVPVTGLKAVEKEGR